ncbi:MAG: hypothetical protein Q7S33_05485 [Nanoarchaeota archaeon]|nr:hypothetical protein [Nanoarchaeota archaeon]
MNKRGINAWDILAWVVLGGILIWIILKTLGVINTPLLLEYAPLFGVVYLAGWAMHKLDSTAEDVKDLKNFAKATANEISNIKANCIKKTMCHPHLKVWV